MKIGGCGKPSPDMSALGDEPMSAEICGMSLLTHGVTGFL